MNSVSICTERDIEVMGRYYFNENPHETMCRERVAKIEEELKQAMTNLDFTRDYNEVIVRELNRKNEEMEHFNALPWWKRMFFKFDLP